MEHLYSILTRQGKLGVKSKFYDKTTLIWRTFWILPDEFDHQIFRKIWSKKWCNITSPSVLSEPNCLKDELTYDWFVFLASIYIFVDIQVLSYKSNWTRCWFQWKHGILYKFGKKKHHRVKETKNYKYPKSCFRACLLWKNGRGCSTCIKRQGPLESLLTIPTKICIVDFYLEIYFHEKSVRTPSKL